MNLNLIIREKKNKMKAESKRALPKNLDNPLNFLEDTYPFSETHSILSFRFKKDLGVFEHKTGNLVKLEGRFPYVGRVYVRDSHVVVSSDESVGVFEIRIVDSEVMYQYHELELDGIFEVKVSKDRLVCFLFLT